jgi:hypothetical protein
MVVACLSGCTKPEVKLNGIEGLNGLQVKRYVDRDPEAGMRKKIEYAQGLQMALDAGHSNQIQFQGVQALVGGAAAVVPGGPKER